MVKKHKRKIIRDYVLVLLSLEIEDLDGDSNKVVHEFLDISPEFKMVDRVLKLIDKDENLRIIDHKYAYKRLTKHTSMNGFVRVLH